MSGSRKILLAGGLALTLLGMTYGLWYAVFAEHQSLEQMGLSLATAFAQAAQRNLPEAEAALERYAAVRFNYVRQVDAHSHWGGLGTLLIILGIIFERVGWSEKMRRALAWVLLAGAFLYPLGVLLQTWRPGTMMQGVTVAGVAMVILAMAAIAAGFYRGGESA